MTSYSLFNLATSTVTLPFTAAVAADGVTVLTILDDGPRHVHDCPACLFVARLGDDDAYVCADGSVVRRASSDPADYGSFPKRIAEQVPCYAEVLTLARAAHIL